MSEEDSKPDPRPLLVLHGGAGVFDKSKSTPEQRERYKSALRNALIAGHQVLEAGGTAMEAAVRAVASMEDCPLFNCAKGAVFNTAGKNELEASIALSKPPKTHLYLPSTRRGFSATLLTCTKNPSKLVEALYTRPDVAPHALLSGSTAEIELGHERLGTELVDPSYFFTEQRWKEHRRGLGLPEGHSSAALFRPPSPAETLAEVDSSTPFDLMPKGTVGAVALDSDGCISVVTSTGGKTNKLVGRIGDTPSMGSGFWAEEWTTTKKKGRLARALGRIFGSWKHKVEIRGVGVSGTGDGDASPTNCVWKFEIYHIPQYFIRQATSAMLAARMKFNGDSIKDAADEVVADLERDGGIGGIIALDLEGNVAFSLNCSGMYRGIIRADGIPLTAIFKEDPLE